MKSEAPASAAQAPSSRTAGLAVTPAAGPFCPLSPGLGTPTMLASGPRGQQPLLPLVPENHTTPGVSPQRTSIKSSFTKFSSHVSSPSRFCFVLLPPPAGL